MVPINRSPSRPFLLLSSQFIWPAFLFSVLYGQLSHRRVVSKVGWTNYLLSTSTLPTLAIARAQCVAPALAQTVSFHSAFCQLMAIYLYFLVRCPGYHCITVIDFPCRRANFESTLPFLSVHVISIRIDNLQYCPQCVTRIVERWLGAACWSGTNAACWPALSPANPFVMLLPSNTTN